jgi:hypothetical protein
MNSSFEYIKRVKKTLPPVFIPNSEQRPVIRQKTLMSFLKDVIFGSVSQDKQNKVVFEIKHENDENLKNAVYRINSNFYAHILEYVDNIFVEGTNTSSVVIEEIVSENTSVDITVSQGHLFNISEKKVLGALSEKYDKQKEQLINEIKAKFEDTTVNDLKQKTENDQKKGLISQLADTIGLGGDTSLKLGQEIMSNNQAKNALNEIYNQIDQSISDESHKTKFLSNYKSKLSEINEIYINKYKGTNSKLKIGVVQEFFTIFNNLAKQNVVHSIYADLNDSKLFQVSDKTLSLIKASGDEYLENKTKDEGLFDFLIPLAAVGVVGGLGVLGVYSMKSKKSIGRGGDDKRNEFIELDLPTMLPDSYFLEENENATLSSEQSVLAQLRRFLLANGKPYPNEKLTKLFTNLKRENYNTTDPTSIIVSREFVQQNFDNQPIELDILSCKKKKIRFNEQVKMLKENEPITLKINDVNETIGSSQGNFNDSKMVDEALFNNYY